MFYPYEIRDLAIEASRIRQKLAVFSISFRRGGRAATSGMRQRGFGFSAVFELLA